MAEEAFDEFMRDVDEPFSSFLHRAAYETWSDPSALAQPVTPAAPVSSAWFATTPAPVTPSVPVSSAWSATTPETPPWHPPTPPAPLHIPQSYPDQAVRQQTQRSTASDAIDTSMLATLLGRFDTPAMSFEDRPGENEYARDEFTSMRAEGDIALMTRMRW